MKLFFSVDALSLRGNQAWRLQEDKTWRVADFGQPLQDSDAKLSDKDEVASWVNMRLKKDKLAGLKTNGKAGVFDFFMRGIFAHVILHRLSPAPVPNKDIMLQTIAQAEVGTPWLLYVDIAGNFRMLHSEENPIIANPNIAVRGEIASSALFIGEEAVKNSSMMDALYHQFIAGWLAHLETSRLSVFIPDIEDIRPIEECVEKIKAWAHESLL
ncbi:MAG: hypothetical protein Q9M19_04710 [Mariprofundaceae bacterium]|nr:hypothetical protein [Mariprofundaceae bacterium]